ncbi:MAG: hypothetical protein AAF587_42575 [Bacteroidota bacterium]
MKDLSIGYGPLIISKIDQTIFQTGSGKSVEELIAAFEKFGDPSASFEFNNRKKFRLRKATNQGIKSIEAIKELKKLTGKGILESKRIIEKIEKGEIIDLVINFDTEKLITMEKLGILIEYPIKNKI